VGVCGFVLEYYAEGNLRDMLGHGCEQLRPLRERVNIAKQITSALLHLRNLPLGFYSDLKLPNILISTGPRGAQAILVDFEHRGGWYSWSPPEVYYLDYFEYLANYAPESKKYEYRKTLQKFVPNWKSQSKNTRYWDSPNGYCTSWNNLSPSEQESAVVFMLGKLLWCLLEDVGSMNGMIINVESFRDASSDLAFPDFHQTPTSLREFIKRCTAGAPEWRGQRSCVVLSRGKLYPRGKTGVGGEPLGTAGETQQAATAWWATELKDAERFMNVYTRYKSGIELDLDETELLKFMRERPKLSEVLQTIEEFL
jgi:serine/threonine protein kinase